MALLARGRIEYGVIATFVNGWIDLINRIGDSGPVGEPPAYRWQGLTRAVLLEGLCRMKGREMDRMCISTGVENTLQLSDSMCRFVSRS
jgi:hypothetical protein